MNSIQRRVFQQDNVYPHTAVLMQHAIVNMLSWPVISPDLFPIEHIWDIFGRQLQHHQHPALTAQVLAEQVQQAWKSRSQIDIPYLYDIMHTHLQACIQNSGGYTNY